MNKRIVTSIAAMSAILLGPEALAASGYVTPTSIRMVITELALVKAGGSPTSDTTTVSEDEYDVTFRKADTDFATINLGDVPVPEGRWDGMRVCYKRLRDVVIDGETYTGETMGSIASGDPIWITSATTGTVSDTDPTTNLVFETTDAGQGGRNDTTCSTGMFAKTVCISPDTGSCESGDLKVDPSETVPDITLVADMYNAIYVEDGAIPWGGFYPYPVVGHPGAAAHFNYNVGTNVADLSMLFNSDGNLMFVWSTGGTGASWCTGQGFVDVTDGPAGALINNPSPVMDLDASTGKLQFAAGSCPDGSSCSSAGMMVVDDVFIAHGATTAARCIADSAATPPYLGYTYTSGAGQGGGDSTITLVRIVDPERVLYSSAECADSDGICGDYP